MAFCKYCGEEIFDNIPHECTQEPPKSAIPTNLNKLNLGKINLPAIKSFLIKLVQKIGVANTELDYFEKGKKIVPESIELDEGEVPIKQYDVAVLQSKIKLARAAGRLQLTNKRILFRANGFSPAGKTTFQQEFALDKIDGVEIRKDYRYRLCDGLFAFFLSLLIMSKVEAITVKLFAADFWMPFLALMGFASCVPFFLSKGKWLQKLLILSVGFGLCGAQDYSHIFTRLLHLTMYASGHEMICTPIMSILYFVSLFLYALKPNLMIEFKTGGGNAVQIRHKDPIFSVKKEEYSGFAEVLPGKDADLAIKEIGTIIDDIKTLGDLGVEKWREK